MLDEQTKEEYYKEMVRFEFDWPILRWISQSYQITTMEYQNLATISAAFAVVAGLFIGVFGCGMYDSHMPKNASARDMVFWSHGHPNLDLYVIWACFLPLVMVLIYGFTRWVVPKFLKGSYKLINGCIPHVRIVRVPVDQAKTAKLEQETLTD